jgi:hypothetical protein
MCKQNLLFPVLIVVSCSLIAAGCGEGDETTMSQGTAATAQDPGSEEVDLEGVYNACLDVIEGTAAADDLRSSCRAIRSAFEGCAQAAEGVPDDSARERALTNCRETAEQSIEQFKAAG